MWQVIGGVLVVAILLTVGVFAVAATYANITREYHETTIYDEDIAAPSSLSASSVGPPTIDVQDTDSAVYLGTGVNSFYGEQVRTPVAVLNDLTVSSLSARLKSVNNAGGSLEFGIWNGTTGAVKHSLGTIAADQVSSDSIETYTVTDNSSPKYTLTTSDVIGVQYTAANGTSNYALSVTASTARLDVGTNAILANNTSSMSASAYVYITAQSQPQEIISNHRSTTSSGWSWQISSSNRLALIFYNADSPNSLQNIFTSSSAQVSDGAWHFLAVSYNGTHAAFWIDSTKETIAGTGTHGIRQYVGQNMWVGNRPDASTTEMLRGTIDELKVWNSTRNDADIENIKKSIDVDPSHLRLHYKFNEGAGTTAADSSGNGFNGTLVNGPTWQGSAIGAYILGYSMSASPSNYAVNFDGVNDYIDTGTLSILTNGTSAATVTAWVKKDATGSQSQPVISNINGGSASGWGFYIDSSDRLVFGFYEAPSPHTNRLYYTSSLHVGNNEWSFVGARWNGTHALLTIDDQTEIISLASSGGIRISNSFYSHIGHRNSAGTGADQFGGDIDDVRVWNAFLSDSNLATVKAGGTVAANLRLAYGMNEGAGTTAADSSGNGFSGTFTNNPTWTFRTLANGSNDYDDDEARLATFNGGYTFTNLSDASITIGPVLQSASLANDDNHTSTFWENGVVRESGAYVVAYLGTSQWIDYVKLKHADSSAIPSIVDVYVSNDGSNWGAVKASKRLYLQEGDQSIALPHKTIAKYVKVQVNTWGDASVWKLYEFDVIVAAGLDSAEPITFDDFGVRNIYPTVAGGQEWYMNKTDMNNDPQFAPVPASPAPTDNGDGTWNMVRIPNIKNEGIRLKIIPETGHTWLNTEMTEYVRLNNYTYSEEFAFISRTLTPHAAECPGAAYYGSLTYAGNNTGLQKSLYHGGDLGGYTDVRSDQQFTVEPLLGRWVGLKMITYTTADNNIKLELWIDDANNNQWQKIDEAIEDGWQSRGNPSDPDGDGNPVDACYNPDGLSRQNTDRILWGATEQFFRADNADIDITNMSIREIDPALTVTDTATVNTQASQVLDDINTNSMLALSVVCFGMVIAVLSRLLNRE